MWSSCTCRVLRPHERRTSGRFRVVDEAGVSWLVDPDGGRFLSLGVNNVSFSPDEIQGTKTAPYAASCWRNYGGVEGWRLEMDPRANAVGRPPLAELVALARCPVHLGRGRDDALVTLAQTRTLDPDASDLGPHGHNIMVEAPSRVWDWVASFI